MLYKVLNDSGIGGRFNEFHRWLFGMHDGRSKNDAQIACSHPSRCIVIMDDTEMQAQAAQRLVVRNRELTQKGAHRCDRKSARFLRQLDKARERFVRNEGVW